MKKTRIIFLLIILFFLANDDLCSQPNNTNVKTHKFNHSVSINSGLSIRYLFGDTYIYPPVNPMHDFNGIHVGFYKLNSYYFNINSLYNISLNEKYELSFGVGYHNRRTIYASDSATVKKYQYEIGNPLSNVIYYEYNPNNIELPVYLGILKNNIRIAIGVNITLFTMYRTQFKYIDGSSEISKSNYANYVKKLYLEFRVSYNILNHSQYRIQPYINIQYEKLNIHYYNIGVGLTKKIFKK